MVQKDKLYKHKMLVKYGKMGYLGWFDHNETNIPHTPSKVVIKTERGLEIGTLVGEHSYRGGNLKTKCSDLLEYFEKESEEYPIGEGGTFVRFASDEDLSEEKHINESAKEELKLTLGVVKELGLDMKIVDFEHVFGGERIVFYFVSDGRVDFRELVKRLAKEFQTRIEMRQIGARDEARLISDYETCGQQCCCSKFLKILKPVNMRMAKVQKATLDPSKISGHCGRLRCCLRYEDETYRELKAKLPNRSTVVKTEYGVGKVVDYQILTQLLQIQYEDGKYEAVPLEEVEILDSKALKAMRAAEGKEDSSKGKPTRNDEQKRQAENRREKTAENGSIKPAEANEAEGKAEDNKQESETDGKAEAKVETENKKEGSEDQPQKKKNIGRKWRRNKNRPDKKQDESPKDSSANKNGKQAKNKPRRPFKRNRNNDKNKGGKNNQASKTSGEDQKQ